MDDRQVLDEAATRDVLTGTAFTHDGHRLVATYETGDFLGAVRLLDRVAEVAEVMQHHPDVRLGYGRITFELWSHDVGGVTPRDLRLAERIEELAAY
ncbi:4a-hydroxytetrahydrobiopterin dehydratase [Agromyces larvae]|uniref:Putative pterin-4-alpha-carbinolamine dehydratase n=1 Tax=Agromyces larvae TaxID=2929802 RepID=A0ABY4BZS3_9MICO|nr:4a-hydroxytetrahydrobiopterin dehydratase [Agromyces larvae]UOE44727.1 4a-hydroxytetrahydrobiopterin dehydratase [Agromyces larvae]